MEIMIAARELASVDEIVSSLSWREFEVTLGPFAHFGTKDARGYIYIYILKKEHSELGT